MRTYFALLSFIIMGAPAFAESEFSLYGGAPSIVKNRVTAQDSDGLKLNFDADWKTEGAQGVPYWGMKFNYWLNESFGLGLNYTHSRAFATSQTLKDSGFSKLNFSKGLNLVTVDAVRKVQTPTAITPYLGAGVGVSLPNAEIKGRGLNETSKGTQSSGLGATAFGGASYSINENWSVFSELKMDYHNVDIDLKDSTQNQDGNFSSDFFSRAVNVGISLSF